MKRIAAAILAVLCLACPVVALEGEAFEQWAKSVGDRGQPLTYTGENLKQIAFPLGGIGSGYIALCGRGHLGQWQIFNNVNKGCTVPHSFFAVRMKPEGRGAVAKLLQMDSIGDMPAIESIEFRGEYPMAYLKYSDKDMPLELRLEAFNPMIPLDAKNSAIPGIYFTFTARNTTDRKVDASFLATLQNAVGYDGYARINGAESPGYAKNLNRVAKEDQVVAVNMTAEPGGRPRMSRPLRVYSNHLDDVSRVIENLKPTVMRIDQQNHMPAADALAKNFDVVWLGDIQNTRFGEPEITTLCKAVELGADLLISGRDKNLVSLAGMAAGATGDEKGEEIVFDDFEGGTYDKWTLAGEAFAKAPHTGASPGQQPVSGFQGKRFVNTFAPNDVPQGAATSKPFKIERRFIHFLIGGGDHSGETCINLKIDGKVVRTQTGRNLEQLVRVSWNVSEFMGREAALEIVDKHSGGWGHINIDDIRFSNKVDLPFAKSTLDALAAMLPISFAGVSSDGEAFEAKVDNLPQAFRNLCAEALKIEKHLRFANAKVKDGARVILSAPDGTPILFEGTHGKGRVMVFNGYLDAGSPLWSGQGTFAMDLLAYFHGCEFTPGAGIFKESPFFGSMALAAQSKDATYVCQWDDPAKLWKDFSEDGKLCNDSKSSPSEFGKTWNAAVVIPLTLEPGESKSATFIVAWHFPNHHRRFFGPPYEIRTGNQYNNWFLDARAVAGYLVQKKEQLDRETKLYHDTLYDSTLPWWLIDCVGSLASTPRTQVVLWYEDGFFGGFEGTSAHEGCCPMNCTHVWNYAVTLSKLWPDLERNVRWNDMKHNQNEDGGIRHRMMYPFDLPRITNVAVDGHCGTVLKVYREYLQCMDPKFLAEMWPHVKKAMDYMMKTHDPDGDGVLEGLQWNTFDCNLTDANTFCGALWLASLRAAEEMAKIKNDAALAKAYHDLFEKGSKNMDSLLWTGEHYIQKYKKESLGNDYGIGCWADQLFGQWWAHTLNLGYIFPKDHVTAALESIYKYNFRRSFVGFEQKPRRFAFDDEMGLLIGTWPKGGRPQRFTLYADECWTGIEYEVGAHMIYEGMVNKGLQLAKAARERYRGYNRNPWDEIECGGNYARALSSWSLLMACQGYSYDAQRGVLGLKPNVRQEDHRSFFTSADGWGTFSQQRSEKQQVNEVAVKYGKIELRQLLFDVPPDARNAKAKIGIGGAERDLPVTINGAEARIGPFDPIVVHAGNAIKLTFTW